MAFALLARRRRCHQARECRQTTPKAPLPLERSGVGGSFWRVRKVV